MNLKAVKELIEFISKSGLSEVSLKTNKIELSIKKHRTETIKEEYIVSAPTQIADNVNKSPANIIPPPPAPPKIASNSKNTITVNSPMIGTFYTSSSPDADPFIKVGDIIKAGDVVGIIEAMKLFNEIESEVEGKVLKVLADNASPVEFDQPLFELETI